MRRGAHVKSLDKEKGAQQPRTLEKQGGEIALFSWHRKHDFGSASHVEDLPSRRPDSGRLGKSQAWGCIFHIAMQRCVVAVGEFLIFLCALFLSYFSFILSIGRRQFIASDLDHMLPTYVMMQRRTMQRGATLSGSINISKQEKGIYWATPQNKDKGKGYFGEMPTQVAGAITGNLLREADVRLYVGVCRLH